LGLGLKFNVKI